ncbi:MAG: SPOR domain-containing protein [Desulfovibrionaceae bacterium]|nr:SPOR domain-containing protein [Desulfovibrionaceae bacterium]
MSTVSGRFRAVLPLALAGVLALAACGCARQKVYSSPVAEQKDLVVRLQPRTRADRDLEGVKGPFWVQVGAFSERSKARALADRLASKGYGQARVSPLEKDGLVYYRVQVGPLEAGSEALGKLREEFPQGLVLTTD